MRASDARDVSEAEIEEVKVAKVVAEDVMEEHLLREVFKLGA